MNENPNSPPNENKERRIPKANQSANKIKLNKRYDEMDPTTIVKLNIGGYKYQTTILTLTSSNSFFTRLLDGKFASHEDEDGFYFIDRDGQYFAPILTFLRTGAISIPPGCQRVDVLREALFFQVSGLAEGLSKETATRFTYLNIESKYGDGLIKDDEENSSKFTISNDAKTEGIDLSEKMLTLEKHREREMHILDHFGNLGWELVANHPKNSFLFKRHSEQ